MAHERLQRAGIYAAPGKGIASAVAQHVDVDGKGQPGGLTKPFNELLGAIDGQRRVRTSKSSARRGAGPQKTRQGCRHPHRERLGAIVHLLCPHSGVVWKCLGCGLRRSRTPALYFAIAVAAGSTVCRWRRCNAVEQRTSNRPGPACR